MRAIKEARKFIERKPDSAQAQTLSRLVLALESEMDFAITDLYALDIDRFNLALQILDEWRLDRYYASKAKLFDASMQLATQKQSQDAPAEKRPRASRTTAKATPAPDTAAKEAVKEAKTTTRQAKVAAPAGSAKRKLIAVKTAAKAAARDSSKQKAAGKKAAKP